MHPFRRVDPTRLTPLVLVVACICWQHVSTQQASAQNDLAFEPYPVFVAHEEAYARCGPAGDYYRTDPLRHGQELEVYAETDDGWLGIRPPADSFCWIPAETVELDSSGETGVIIEDRTVAWIGTHLGRARTYRWQVQLAEGEPVTVVGRSERDGPDGPQLWYRIVPPSGEYRWVHRDQVVMSSEELVASIRRSSGGEEPIPGKQPTIAAQPTQAAQPTIAASIEKPDVSPRGRAESSRRQSPEPRAVASSGQSILEQSETLGSGLSEDWEANEVRQSVDDATRAGNELAAETSPAPATTVTEAMKRGGLLASVEFLGRPRLLEIGGAPSAPGVNETAVDSNWVAGFGRPRGGEIARVGASTQPETPFVNAIGTSLGAPSAIMQASGQQPIAPTMSVPTVVPASATTIVVSAERIAQIEAEARDADVEQLTLIFSRLIAGQATAAETEPVARAARHLASTLPDPVAAGRARLLAERADQYRGVAGRRDGELAIRSSLAPTIANSQTFTVGSPDTAQVHPEPNNDISSQTGYLVQVYSARTNSPPFALTDNTGRTVAYVTPSPGVNLRTHLNSKVSVFGSQGFLTGLNTPHILATQAVRTPE